MIRCLLGVAALTAVLTAACGGDDKSSSAPTPISNPGGGSGGGSTPPGGCTLPPAPANLRVTSQVRTLVELSWNEVAGATSYSLLVGAAPGGTDIMNASTSSTSFRFAARDGKQYARVQAHTACGAGPISGSIEFTVS